MNHHDAAIIGSRYVPLFEPTNVFFVASSNSDESADESECIEK